MRKGALTTIDSIRLFAEYNQKANYEMNKSVSKLSGAEWTKDLGGYYPTVKAVCAHLYVSDLNWMKRFSLVQDFEVLKRPPFLENHGWDAVLIDSITDYLEKRAVLDDRLVSFVDEASGGDLETELKYMNWKGEEQVRNCGGLFLHFFNHQTHHRAMISVYLEMLGYENEFSSLVPFV